MKRPLFITGIGTDVGKTIVSAVFVEQLKADYWKPVQAGDLHYTDSDKIRTLISNPVSVIHAEAFRLTVPASPHNAARQDGLAISPDDFSLPKTSNQLIIEGAGGLFVPLSNNFLMINLISQLNTPVILVVRNYLGCINHTLLSIHALVSKNLILKHIVFNGTFDGDTLNVLLHHLPIGTTWSFLPELGEINSRTIAGAPDQTYFLQPLNKI